MNKLSKLVTLVVVLVLVFTSACQQSVTTAAPPATTTISSTNTPAAPATATLVPTATFDQFGFPTDTPVPTALPIGKCSLLDGTAQVQIEKIGDEWIVDPANLKVVAGYNNSLPGHDVSEITGCDMWVEYELSRTHVIDVLRDDPTKALAFLGEDGKYHIPSPMGGSFWVGPSGWNTSDLSTDKPSIALEMASAKNANQLRNGYDWPEEINLPDGSVVTYEVGHVYGGFYPGCKDLETSPAPINVAGTIIDGKYNASIGMEGCVVAVKVDGSWTFWHDAHDNVLYTTVEAWLFKADASEADVQKWIDSQ